MKNLPQIAMGLVVTLFGSVSAAAIITLPPPLQPAGPWSVNYGDTGCELKRDFGSGAQAVTLSFLQALAPLEVGVAIRGVGSVAFDGADRAALASAGANHSEASIRFAQTRSPAPDDARHAGTFRTLAPFHSASGDAVMELLNGRNYAGGFRLSEFAQALTALRACQDDLYRTSGIDAAAMRRIAVDAEPANNEATWATTDDLPRQFADMDGARTAAARLDVGTNGRVTNCSITTSTGEPLLDLQSCRVLLARARYNPAQDAEGNAVPTIKTKRIRWQAPR